MYMLYIWYWCTCDIVHMSYMLCCRHVIQCMCIVLSWYRDICIHCVVLCVRICVVLYTRCRCMCAMSGVGACIAWCCMSCVVAYV